MKWPLMILFLLGQGTAWALSLDCADRLKEVIQTHDQRFREARQSVREFLRGIPDIELQRILELERQVSQDFKALRLQMMKDADFWKVRSTIIDYPVSKILVAERNAVRLTPLLKRFQEPVLQVAKMELEKGTLISKNFLPPGKAFSEAAYSTLRNNDLSDFWKDRIARFDRGLEPLTYPGASWQVSLWRQPESRSQAELWVVYRALFAGDKDELWELPPVSIDNGSSTLFFQPKGGQLHPMPAGVGGENITYNAQNTRSLGSVEVAFIPYRFHVDHGVASWKGFLDVGYSRMIGGQLPPSCRKSLKYDSKSGMFDGKILREIIPPDQKQRYLGITSDIPLPNTRVLPLEI